MTIHHPTYKENFWLCTKSIKLFEVIATLLKVNDLRKVLWTRLAQLEAESHIQVDLELQIPNRNPLGYADSAKVKSRLVMHD